MSHVMGVLAGMSADAAVAAWAAGHYGMFRTGDARQLGMSPTMLQTRRRDGLVERVEPGVWRYTSAPIVWEQRALAAAWTSRALTSHRTAAALLQLDGCRPGIIEVLTERWRRRPNASIRIHETRLLDDEDRSEVRGIPATSPARTVVDLGAVLPFERVDRATDSIWQRRLATGEEVWACIERLDTPGRPWVHAAKVAAARRMGVDLGPNRFEERLLRLAQRAGLPSLQPQVEVRAANGSFIGRVDWLVPALGLILECDSFEWHGAWHRRVRDLRRDRRLVAAGYTVLRFSWEDVTRLEDHVVADLRDAARQRRLRSA